MTKGDAIPPELVAVLRFEARYANAGDDRRTELVRTAFGLSLTRYRQRLLRAIEHPGAEAIEPVTVHRLRRLLTAQRAKRDSWTPQPVPPRGA